MTLTNRDYLHILNCFPEFGPIRLGKLADHFPDFSTAYSASGEELFEAGIEPHIIDEWLDAKNKLDPEKLIQKLDKHKINLLLYSDDEYPQLLRELPQSPPILYYQGTLGKSDELCLGVVGTRKMSAYGQTVTKDLVIPLSQAGVTIVSGLAYGVDAAAHKATLKAGGRTIAVLGGGLDDATIYPQRNLELAHEIIDQGGLLLSEYPPERPSLPQHFVVRNRIIAGISVGVLIVECDIKSGTLITAKDALDQNRDVYAVPGPIYSPVSAGTNQLLKEGAKMITSAEDILQDLQIPLALQTMPSSFIPLTEQEQKVLVVVNKLPQLADDIIARVKLDPSITTAALTFLEIKGCIKNVGGQQYVRTK